jgi:hypothetical protein
VIRATQDEKKLARKLWIVCAVLVVGVIAILCLQTPLHFAGMRLACDEHKAKMADTPRFLGKRLEHRQLEAWMHYHRDALVRKGRLVHRNYRFDRIPVPSAEAKFLEDVFLRMHAGLPTEHFLTSGKSPWGAYYEVNLWCDPDEVVTWDAWHRDHNDLNFVLKLIEASSQE